MFLLSGTTSTSTSQSTWQTDFLVPMSPILGFHMRASIYVWGPVSPSHADGGASSTAEASTLQLEMKYLAHLTGKNVYWRKAEEVIRVLDDNDMEGGLLPIFVHPDTGRFTSREIRLGSRGDSYYGVSGSRFT